MRDGVFPGAGDVRLFYRRIGHETDALVFVHGGPASSFRGSGEDMVPLATGRTLLLYDQRGGGWSELVADPARLTMADNVADLEALRRHFRLERMTLVALSFGAAIAASYADAHPDRVAGLVLLSPMAPTRALWRERTRALNDRLGPELARRRDTLAERIATAGDSEVRALCQEHSNLVFRLYLARPTRAKLDHAALRCTVPASALRHRDFVRRTMFEELGDYDLRPMLARLNVPTLVMEGERSEVPLDATRVWAETIRGARLALIADAGHEFFVDEPAAFHREVELFLTEIAP